jgi:hypothetical protein
MSKRFSNILLLTSLFPVLAMAVIIRVPQDYPTIQLGINAANAGDIVVVAPGTYYEEITLKADVIVRGAGEAQSIIHGNNDNGDVVFATGNDIDNDTKLQGFTVTGAVSGGSMPGGAGIFCNSGAKPDISNNRVEANDFGIVTWNGSNAYIHNNVVVDQNFDGIVVNADPDVINNTVVDNRIGVYDGGGYSPVVMNNIVTNSTLYGIYAVGASPVLTYNDVWNNATNYQNCSPGTGSISADPLFIDPPDDFHLLAGSPCIDSGNPAAQYNDPDGSRNDMGAYGGPGAYIPFPQVVLVTPGQGAINVDHGTDITAMFNMAMDSSTINTNSVRLFGWQTGFNNGAVAYDSAGMIVTLDPMVDLLYGETYDVLLTRDIQSTSGDSLNGFTWSFTTRVDSGSGLFNFSSSYASGSHPAGGISADFNSDANSDIVVVNTVSNNVSVFIGLGNGTFQPAVNYSVGTQPQDVCVSDFNEDGNLDITAANQGSGNITLLLGNGDGTFYNGGNFATGSDPYCVSPADINNDGHFDLAITNTLVDSIAILNGNGSGSFSAPVQYSAGNTPQAILGSDLDKDGAVDLAVVNNGGASISILLNGGDGSFLPKVDYSVGAMPWDICVSDFNQDSNIDLAVTNYGANNISVLLGNGNGTFNTATNYSTGGQPTGLCSGDFNADNMIDLAAANFLTDDISILAGISGGGFEPAVQYNTGTSPSGICFGDFDNDHDLDLMTVSQNVDSIAVLLNENALIIASTVPLQNELGVAESTDISAVFSIAVDSLTISDSSFMVMGAQSGIHFGTLTYNSGTYTASIDPDLDFCTGEVVTGILTKDIQAQSGPFLNGFVWDFTSRVTTPSDGTFENPLNFATGIEPRGFFAADFDADSDIDISTTSNSGNICVLLNNGDGTFAAPLYTAVQSDPIALYGADLDMDGDIDLASAHNQAGSSHLMILKNNGSGIFTVFASYVPATLGQNLSGGDLDADADIDLVMTDGWGSGDNVRVMLNNGDGSFSGPYTYTAGTWARGIACKDIDNDGDIDLAVTNSGDDNVSILRNDGDAGFSGLANYPVGSSPTAVYGNDLNADHYVDLVTANYGSNDITVILNNGDGTFGGPDAYSCSNNTRAVHGADLDGDDDIDLVASNNGTNSLTVLLNNGDGTYGDIANYSVGMNPWSNMCADYDLDNAIDIGCSNYGSDNITVLYNTGTGISENGSDYCTFGLTIYPNPCYGCTNIGFQIPRAMDAEIDIYDAVGRLIKRFSVAGAADNTALVWDGTDEHGRIAGAGVYFCQLRTEEKISTKQIVIIR